MIEPVVFPFTFLDANTARLLLSSFNRIQVYIPTDSARNEFDPEVLETGRVDVCNPLSDSGLVVDQIFGDYRQWRQANRGTDISFFKTSDSDIPFFNENAISFLRQDILRSVPGTSEQTTDLLLAARVFLRMTSNYDRVQEEISDALLSQNEKESSMLAALQGEDDDDEDDEKQAGKATNPLLDDPGELMTAERLSAWSMLAAEAAPLASLLVTASRAVLAEVMTCFENNALMWESIPVSSDFLHRDQPAGEQWRNDLANFLSDLMRSGNRDPDKNLPPTCTKDKADALLTIIHLPEVSPRSFLEKFCHNQPTGKEIKNDGAPSSTVVAAVLPA